MRNHILIIYLVILILIAVGSPLVMLHVTADNQMQISDTQDKIVANQLLIAGNQAAMIKNQIEIARLINNTAYAQVEAAKLLNKCDNP